MKLNLFTTKRSQLFTGERGTPRPVAESVLSISSSPQSRVSADGWLQNTLASNKFPTINTKQSLSSASRKVLQHPTLQTDFKSLWYPGKQLLLQKPTQTQQTSSLSGRNHRPAQKHPLSLFLWRNMLFPKDLCTKTHQSSCFKTENMCCGLRNVSMFLLQAKTMFNVKQSPTRSFNCLYTTSALSH